MTKKAVYKYKGVSVLQYAAQILVCTRNPGRLPHVWLWTYLCVWVEVSSEDCAFRFEEKLKSLKDLKKSVSNSASPVIQFNCECTLGFFSHRACRVMFAVRCVRTLYWVCSCALASELATTIWSCRCGFTRNMCVLRRLQYELITRTCTSNDLHTLAFPPGALFFFWNWGILCCVCATEKLSSRNSSCVPNDLRWRGHSVVLQRWALCYARCCRHLPWSASRVREHTDVCFDLVSETLFDFVFVFCCFSVVAFMISRGFPERNLRKKKTRTYSVSLYT